MTQPQNMTGDASSEPVTDGGVEGRPRGAPDADSRDVTCTRCGRPVGDTVENPVCFPRSERLHRPCCLACVRDVVGTWALGWKGGYAGTCRTCGRHMLGPFEHRAACSDHCHREAEIARARDRRRRMREAVTPEAFTCSSCEKEIEAAIVFWWNGNWGQARAHDVTWCEPCWASMQIEEAREDHERHGDEPNIFGYVYPDPDAEGYDPFAQIGRFEAKPCGNCGRSIRWGNPGGYCCPYCKYEDTKARRRVQRTERKCEVCGGPFTPKRKDGKTCSDKCRQALSRNKRKPKKRVTATGDRRSGTSPRDAVNRDKRRKGSR